MATWPWSVANAIFFFLLFIDAKLYADAWLQVFYLVLSVGGFVWWKWGRERFGHREEAPIKRTSPLHFAVVAAGVTVFTILFIPHLRSLHDPYPVLDALTTGMSVGAQYLLSLRRIVNWPIWIAADFIYIPLYQAKGLTLTAIIYVVFLGLCFVGVRDWRRQLRAQRNERDTLAMKIDAEAAMTGIPSEDIIRINQEFGQA